MAQLCVLVQVQVIAELFILEYRVFLFSGAVRVSMRILAQRTVFVICFCHFLICFLLLLLPRLSVRSLIGCCDFTYVGHIVVSAMLGSVARFGSGASYRMFFELGAILGSVVRFGYVGALSFFIFFGIGCDV